MRSDQKSENRPFLHYAGLDGLLYYHLYSKNRDFLAKPRFVYSFSFLYISPHVLIASRIAFKRGISPTKFSPQMFADVKKEQYRLIAVLLFYV